MWLPRPPRTKPLKRRDKVPSLRMRKIVIPRTIPPAEGEGEIAEDDEATLERDDDEDDEAETITGKKKKRRWLARLWGKVGKGKSKEKGEGGAGES